MRVRPLAAALLPAVLSASLGAAQPQSVDQEHGLCRQSDPAPASQSYRVVSGDTLSEIAERHHVSLTDIRAANELGPLDLLREGQTITIPSSAEPEVDSARAREPTRNPASVQDRDPPAGAPPESLSVTPASTVYFYRPLGRGRLGLKPVIVYLHGRGNQPELDCQRWAPIVRKLGWLVCPSGPEDRGRGRGWQNDWALGQRIVMASIAALRERFGRRVQLYGNTLIGFSEGAFVAMNIGVREPRVFNRWLILAGSSSYWGGPGLDALSDARRVLKRVFFITGAEDAVMPGTADAERRLLAARVSTRVAMPQDMGHEVWLESKGGLYEAALVWLDRGKGAPRERNLVAHSRIAAR
jgi:LysM repeat protein/predicted esterase